MEKKMSLRTYKSIDIAIFTIITIIFQYLVVVGINLMDVPMYSITLAIPISLIVMMRWGIWAFIPTIAGSITYALTIDGSVTNIIIYVLGDLFIMFCLLWFIKGKDKVRNNIYICISYVISGYLLVELGRTIISIFYGNEFLNVLIGFLGVDALSACIALVIILIARKQNGLFEDQIKYLIRINKEMEEPNNEG